MVLVTTLIVIVLSLVGWKIYKWMSDGFDLFEKLGIPFVKPILIFGSSFKLYAVRTTIREYLHYVYTMYPEAPVVGIFDLKQPIFVIRDPELVKQMGVKDFDHFADHRSSVDPTMDPIFTENLVNLKGQKWRDMRATLSPVFTGSKMRQMFELVSEIGAQMAEYFRKVSKEERIIEFKDTCSRFTNDVIATAAFGIQVDSLKYKENSFYKSAKTLMDFGGYMQGLRFLIVLLLPKLAKMFKIQMMPSYKTKFFKDLIVETMDAREKEGIHRPDLIHLMMQLKKGILKNELIEHKDESFAAVDESDVGRVVVRRQWTDNELLAQCFIFFLAGYETSSTAMSFLAYELGVNPDVQKKLIEEIDYVNEQLNGNKLTFDALQGMKYMDMVISESLRLWPPAEITDRLCVKDYKMKNEKGEEYIIKKGQNVWFPIENFHADPKYFKNPNKFYPERFSSENRHNINPTTYLPFGIGPRNCIGSRFALMEIKCGFYYLLLNFTIEICEKTQVPLQLTKGFVMRGEKGIWFELKPREK